MLPPLAIPQSQELHIWQLYLPNAQPYRDHWLTWLAVDERDRAQRFLRERDRDRFILSRGGLRYRLAQYLTCTPAALKFTYGTYGKPRLVEPIRPLHFNLAHSGNWVIYGFSRCQWIGVDVEQITERTYLEALIHRCLTPDEQATLPQAPAKRLKTFLQYWTIKEAHLKAIGLGLSYPLTEVAVALTPKPYLKRPAQIGNKTGPEWTTTLWQPNSGAIAAACVGQSDQQIMIHPFF